MSGDHVSQKDREGRQTEILQSPGFPPIPPPPMDMETPVDDAMEAPDVVALGIMEPKLILMLMAIV
jgi:hypothetical protein